MNKIVVNRTYTSIPNYNIGDDEFLENQLSIWDKVYFRHNNIGFQWNEETKELRIPRSYSVNSLSSRFRELPMEFNYEHDPEAKVVYTLKYMPKNNIQKKAISFLLGDGDFAYSKKYSQLSLNLDTGDGKTYCTIAYLTFVKTTSMIITHNNSIKGQWYESFLKFTSLSENHILDIDGSSAITKILKMLDKKDTLPYKVYLVNHATIRNYAKKHGWDSIKELFIKLKIGVKVFDEAHLEFANLISIDLNTNTKRTLYLTANFKRDGIEESKIFKLCYGHVVSYGVETRNDKRKHIKYLGVLFNTYPSIQDQASVKNIHGFDKNRYCDYLIEKDEFFNVVTRFTKLSFKNKGKVLILLSKIHAGEIMKEHLDYVFKEENINKTVSIYNSKISHEDKEKALMSDVIISTQKSLGTGNDIPGLRTVIMTEAYSSKIIANQTSGRLRVYSDEDDSFYIELVDIGFNRAYKMYKSRLSVFKKKCKELAEITHNR